MTTSTIDTPLEEACLRAYVAELNAASDNHIRKTTYEDMLDPRNGAVRGVKAIIAIVRAHAREPHV